MADGISITRDGAVLVLRFDRTAKKNAIIAAMYEALADALTEASGDENIGVCILLGSPGCFTASSDIGDFIRARSEGRALTSVTRFLRALATLDRPLMAGVDGIAVGVGTTILLHCDYVLATPRALLRTPLTALGLVPETASSLLGPRVMGYARAFALLVMGGDLDAEASCDTGIVNAIVAPDELEARLFAEARSLAVKPREAVLAARRLLKGNPAEILARIDTEAAIFAERLRSPEAQAVFAAFVHKGEP